MKIHNPLSENLTLTCDKAASILEHFIKGTNDLDRTLIPTAVVKQAAGFAILTVVKAGFIWSGRGGTGLVVARLPDGSWSAPSAICAAGVGVGAQLGCQITDIVFVLNTTAAVKAFCHGNVTLGGNVSIAAGPTGRSTEAAGCNSFANLAIVNPAAIYSYSKSKGAFAGITLEGTVILTRKKTNRTFYGREITADELLEGRVPQPTAAEPLYRMLNLKFGDFFVTFNTTLTESPPTSAAPAKPKKKPVKCIALYNFEAQEEGDLSFKEGDEIWVTERNGDWIQGTLKGRKGTLPASYVEIV